MLTEIADDLDVHYALLGHPAGLAASEEEVAGWSDRPGSHEPSEVRDVGPGPRGLRVKRVFDLTVGSLLVVPIAPIGALIALVIRRTSHGPALFRQTRVGLHGRTFEIYKFRTMVHDADERKRDLLHMSEADGLFKIKADPRLTPVGRMLRQTYLDELPQLINVLRGDMSLVGPRPLVPDEDASFKGSSRQRLQVPPGMTGEWQVHRGGGASRDEMIALDYRYVAEWSLWRDVRCLLKTVAYMCGRKGW
jgi:lipopolysaccharide/colanic/teichoic acid biosynthesis glycosyltransferase